MSKNIYHTSGSVTYIELNNVTPSRFLSCSREDVDTLTQYRWRYIDGQPVTTKLHNDLEVRHTIDSILYNVDRLTLLTRRDKNVLNCQRDNVSMSPSRKQNVFVEHAEVTYLLLPNAQTVLIDTESVPLVSSYLWYALSHRGNVSIMAKYLTDGAVRRVQLPRLLLGLSLQDNRPVRFRNNDRFDCRMINMYMEDDL